MSTNSIFKKLVVNEVFGSALFDNLKVRFKLKHEPTAEFLPYKIGKEKTTRAAIKLSNWYSNTTLTVRSSAEGNYLTVDGSYVKWLTGQNIAGSEKLIRLSYDVFCGVTSSLGIKPSPGELEAVLAGDFELLRVDYTVHCDLGSLDLATAFQRQLKKLLCTSALNYSHYRGFQTLYINQHGDRWTFKSYLKGVEVNAKCGLENIPGGKNLQRMANQLVRLELTLRSKYLGEHYNTEGRCLTSPLAWRTKDARMLFRRFLRKRLKSLSGFSEDKATIGLLTSKEKLVLATASSNFALDGIINSRQIKAFQKSIFEKIGVDIFLPLSKGNSKTGFISLKDIFRKRLVFRSRNFLYKYLRDVAKPA